MLNTIEKNIYRYGVFVKKENGKYFYSHNLRYSVECLSFICVNPNNPHEKYRLLDEAFGRSWFRFSDMVEKAKENGLYVIGRKEKIREQDGYVIEQTTSGFLKISYLDKETIYMAEGYGKTWALTKEELEEE